jgi:FKBP-type peptidyl-prolyl cis-trans isomerase SlyD
MSVNSLTVAGDVVVTIDYTLTVDGKVVGSTIQSGPMQYLHGHQNILPGLEHGLDGLYPGESKEIFIPADQAYGPFDPGAFAELDKNQFPPSMDLEIGFALRVRDEQGQVRMARISSVGEQTVTLDLNHPLAGKDLSFAATVLDIRPATEM